MAYMQCPECKLTVPAAAYYLKGDQCPRCLTQMVPSEGRRAGEKVVVAAVEPARPSPAAPSG